MISCALPQLCICLEFDWFTGLAMSFVIGQKDQLDNHLGFLIVYVLFEIFSYLFTVSSISTTVLKYMRHLHKVIIIKSSLNQQGNQKTLPLCGLPLVTAFQWLIVYIKVAWPIRYAPFALEYQQNAILKWCCMQATELRSELRVRVLTFHQCGWSSNPGLDAIMGLSLWLVLALPQGFFSGFSSFPPCTKLNTS